MMRPDLLRRLQRENVSPALIAELQKALAPLHSAAEQRLEDSIFAAEIERMQSFCVASGIRVSWDGLIDPRGAARLLGVKSPKLLAKWRDEGRGPPYVKGQGRNGRITYALDALAAFRLARHDCARLIAPDYPECPRIASPVGATTATVSAEERHDTEPRHHQPIRSQHR